MARATIEGRLNTLRKELAGARPPVRGRPAPARSRRPLWQSFLIAAARVAVVVLLPFVVYVRASVGFHGAAGFSPWFSVVSAALLTLGVAAGYAAWIARRTRNADIARPLIRLVALPTAFAWCAYSALYLSRVNAKTDAIRSYYGSVHPVLRVAIATAILGDPGLVVTDAARVPADYRRMGLPVNDATRHYRQRDGWVHAVDLRTNGRGEIRNRALQLYFRAMGFRTLRHVGTSDHLHVQLASRR